MVVFSRHGGVGGWLDLMVLEVFSNLRFYEQVIKCDFCQCETAELEKKKSSNGEEICCHYLSSA